MMAAVGGQGIPVAPLVLDDAESLEVMAAAVMRLHSTLLTIGRCYTTDATGERAARELERIESVLAGAFCTIFGQSPADRFTDIFDQTALRGRAHGQGPHLRGRQQTHQPCLCVVRP